jgi:hypothetical protein
MPAITYDQFLTASMLALQGGEGAAASGVHRGWVKQLLPSALNKLAENVAEDPTKRPLLVKEIEVPIVAESNGIWKGTISGDLPADFILGAEVFELLRQDGARRGRPAARTPLQGGLEARGERGALP